MSFEKHEITDVDMEKYRLPPEKLVEVNETLKFYEGTKNYHNFTSRKYVKPLVFYTHFLKINFV